MSTISMIFLILCSLREIKEAPATVEALFRCCAVQHSLVHNPTWYAINCFVCLPYRTGSKKEGLEAAKQWLTEALQIAYDLLGKLALVLSSENVVHPICRDITKVRMMVYCN